MILEIEASLDNQKCSQCGKITKDCMRKPPNEWLCHKCIIKNIKNYSPIKQKE